MRRRSILKWIALTAISLTAVFTLFTIVNDDRVAAAISKKQSSHQGSLQAMGQDGKPAGECPLKHTEVKAEVSGFISRVTVTQDFENSFPNKIEAVYTFPLPEAAAVDDLTMVIGERTIKGKVMRRQEAKATYTAAKQAGQIATLLDQQRPNVFTQQVANILPGERIRVRLSYVETLKYEDGAYEWSFPMVVGERYTPANDNAADADSNAASIAPANVPDGMRLGHDISIELDLDAGLPIVSVNSATHETEVAEIDQKHTVVRLKDRATIPNKDFVLTYRVAGDSIDDAVLAHRSERGGFFTLILQPPQRVAAEDVMPKELVFVLDTSGSMSGFPIEKAKETMDLALNTLNPQDTFNMITFSGDTKILFPAPVPATRQNLQTAKKFLASQQGNGGTEMMKAIKAALDPSDSQHHVRIACFMTDGQVGNDGEIIAEVQKHTNARVFAMGFGPAPNRYLLDRMSNYGRGEVNYVPETGDTSSAARRFNDRVRNPLLTDITIDWGNLPVHDVYPKRIPDLFGAKPLIVSGRYDKGGKGTIRLRGRMAGQDFVREIPVELPETESDHDALSTLWARRRIDDLMSEELTTYTDPTAADQKREEITQLGLDYKLMTQYTSFVAVDDAIFTGTDQPQRVDVPVQIQPGMISSLSVNLSSGATCSVTTNCIVTHSIQMLPVNGRSFIGLMTLTPGVAETRSVGSFVIDGARPSSNQYKVDGVSANFGIVAGGMNPGPSASGNMLALTASGGGNGIAALDSIQEVRVQTSPTQPEFGRSAGGQIQIVTRAGTNEFHGSVFHFFGNDALDANDWFANSRDLRQPDKQLNMFGGSFGGPIKKDHIFFFGSYEGMRSRQPKVGITDVPSLTSRATAAADIQPFLEAFPVPTGPARADGFAEFASSFANPAQHDVGSLRIDNSLRATTMLRGRYSFADSDATQRGANWFSLNTQNKIRTRSHTITGFLTETLSPNMIAELNANYSRARVSSSYLLDSFGDAVIPQNLFNPPSFAFDLSSRNAAFMLGDEASSVQRQFNLTGSILQVVNNHELKFGADYLRLSPIIGQRPFEQNVLFNGMAQAIARLADRVNFINHAGSQNPVYSGLSLYAQDEWKRTSRLTFTYGLRWELAPAPSSNGVQPLAVDQVTDPTRLQPAAADSQLWNTTFLNFAPRANAAYALTDDDDFIVRGGIGILYDVGGDTSGDAFATSIPFISGSAAFNTLFPSQLSPAGTAETLPFMAFDPRLKLPYTINWNVSLARSLGINQSISAAYVGSSGKRLLHTETLLNQNPDFDFLRLVTNRGSSDYRALQLSFDRGLHNGLAALVSYTWSRSMDNVTDDSPRRVVMTSLDPDADRGPSDFDVRHQLTGYITYELPAPVSHGLGHKVLRNWALDSIFNTRSARPLNVVYMIPTSFGVAYFRPDVVSGTSLFILDPLVGGGRRVNRAAFLIPVDLQQGNLDRNSLRGFHFYQVDLALRRKFNFSEAVGLQIQADAFNVFNHPNFEDPIGNDLVVGPSLSFGQSTSSSGRTVRLSVKFLF